MGIECIIFWVCCKECKYPVHCPETMTLPVQILYGKGQSVEVDGKLTQKLMTGLEPDTQYSFLLTNRANSAGGLQHRVTATTAPDLLKTRPVVVGKTNADGMVTVQLPTVQTAAKVR